MRSIFLSLFLLLSCRNDGGIKEFNSLPSVQIESHGDGSNFLEGDDVRLTAQVSDGNHSFDELVTTWYADDDILCEEAPPVVDGISICDIQVESNTSLIRVTVRDPQDGGGEDSITVVVTDNAPPLASISAPLDGDTYTAGQIISFTGFIEDEEDSPELLTYSWTSDIDGDLDFDVEPDSSGQIQDGVSLTEGEHRVTLEVTDTGGKTGSDSISLTILGENTPPTCLITSPADNEIFNTAVLDFTGEIGDQEDLSEVLNIQWYSSIDGILDTGPSDPTGVLAFTKDLSSGEHNISLMVEDSGGLFCDETITITIESAPILTILSPLDGEYYNITEPIVFHASVSDGTDLPESLSVNWESSLEGIFASSSTAPDGNSTTNSSLFLNGPHIITATVTDSDNNTASASVSINLNAPPTAPSLSISPNPAYTTENITVVPSGSLDLDGDPISYQYQWYLNGVLSTASSSDTLPATSTVKNDTWEVVVTPVDLLTQGPGSSTTVDVINSPPTVDTINVLPYQPTNRDSLFCSGSATDPDFGDALSLSYQWENVNTGVQLSTNDSMTLDTSSASVGDEIRCTITATDPDGATGSTSASLTVDNTDPALSSVLIIPTNPNKESTVTCSATTSDPDGDPVSLSYEWSTNGNVIGASQSLDLSQTSILRNAPLTCTVTADDGNNGSATDATTTTINNAAPSLQSVDILVNGVAQSTGQADDTLTCVPVGFLDPDGDTAQYIYQWSINGLPSASSSSISGVFAKGDLLSCQVTPFDGNAFGNSVSNSISIINSAPEIFDLTLSPSTPNTNDTITVTIDAVDADSDTITYTYDWMINGNSVSSSTSLDYSLTTQGDDVSVEVTPSDGSNPGSPYTSATVTVVNAAPVINSIGVSPISPNNRDTLTCSMVASDSDTNDTLTLSYQWTNDTTGSTLSTSNTTTLSPSLANVGDTLSCTGVAMDSSGETDTASVQVVVANTLATITGLSIIPSQPSKIDTVECSGTIDDLDGDSLSVQYEWTTSSGTIGSNDTLDLTNTSIQRGAPLTCSISVDDGHSVIVTESISTTIVNAAPSLSSVLILVNGISSSIALAGDTLTCVPQGYNDADGDAAQYIYQWTINGSPASSSATLSNGFTRGDTVSCQATPFDGFGFGTHQVATVSIDNSPPVVTDITLSPSSPTNNSTISAAIISSDGDGDTVTYAYEWFVNSLSVSTSSTLSSSFITQGDTLYLRVTPSDGFSTGNPFTSNTLTVDNTLPTAPTIIITPSTPIAGVDDLVCTVAVPSTDADGDTVTYSMTWLQNAVLFNSTNTTNWPGDTISASDLQVNDTWTCVATPNDGTDNGPTASANKDIDECLDGSLPECAANSCLDILQNGLAGGDGEYYLNLNGAGTDAYYCDMSNGGWTGIRFYQAETYLSGVMVAVDDANIDGIHPTEGPYTQDSTEGHSYHYTFDFDPGFSEFRFLDYDIRANADGSIDTSDLDPSVFIMSDWNQAFGSTKGDVGFGAASQVGPVANLSVEVGTNINCNSCTYTMGTSTYSIGSTVSQFRIGWGEYGSQSEGWYPWYDGLILLR